MENSAVQGKQILNDECEGSRALWLKGEVRPNAGGIEGAIGTADLADMVLAVGVRGRKGFDEQIPADGARQTLSEVGHQSVQVRPAGRVLAVRLQHQPTRRHVKTGRVHVGTLQDAVRNFCLHLRRAAALRRW